MSLTIVGDIHGQYAKKRLPNLKSYKEVIKPHEFTLQLGDMGYDYRYLLDHINPDKHKFFGGNHENYSTIDRIPHNIGNYGTMIHGDIEFSWIRGAFSIDKEDRIKNIHRWGKTWFEEEEISYTKLGYIVDGMINIKPEIIITHTAPLNIIRMMGNPQILRNFGYDPNTFKPRTQSALQVIFDQHQPKEWIFGHMHRSWSKIINGTKFTCVPEAGAYTIE